ncbi:uncharacterized protein [Dermacentor andersoni]|uniref:uncharacterized protein isoform X2 n=1 Tax=Dermacentor andersoni TaxID=34620 RepID=UPI0024161A57|nr:uncharacterized protein LOC126531110 isoform X2 [Dermacentor andersoni]
MSSVVQPLLRLLNSSRVPMDETNFLDDTDLESLHTSEPRATSTVLSDQRIRLTRPACGDIATNLFHDPSDSDSSLGLLTSNDCLDFSLLDIPARLPAAEQVVMEEKPSRSSSNAYLRERFDVSEADVDAQAALGFEESFTDDAAEKIQQDEQQFNKEHLLDAYEESSSMYCGGLQYAEISRPSWMSSGGDDRVTISAYLRSRSAPVDQMMGFLRAPPAFEESEKESASASDQLSIQDLVEQQLGLRKSTYSEQYEGQSQDSSLLSQQSASGIDHSLEGASSSGSKMLANKCAGATHLYTEASKRDSPLYRQAQGDGYFKRPLGAAPRARASRISTVSTSSSASQSRSSGLASMSTLTASRTVSRVSSPQKKDRSQLPIRCKKPPLSAGSQNVLLKSPSRLHHKVSPIPSKVSRGPRSTNGSVKHSQRNGDSQIQLRSVPHRLSSFSSPDLRTLKSGGRDRQLPVAISTCKSDENFLIPQRDEPTMNNAQLPAREQFGHSRSTPKNPASQFFSTAGSTQAPSYSPVFDSQSMPAPSGLLLPVDFVEHSRIDLGTICAGAPRNVALALVNPTGKKQRYQIQQLCSSIGGHEPRHFESVTAQFPGQHTVAGGCVAKIQGSFLSLSPGAVEITVGIVAKDKADGGYQNLYSVNVVAQVEQPCIILEPSQTINFKGLHFDAEQSSTDSSASQEVIIVNKNSCAVPAIVRIHGGKGVFSVRLKESEGTKKDQAAATALPVVFPSKEEQAATSFIVECSTHSADCLTVQAKMEVQLDGSLLSRKVLAEVGLCASVEPPSLALEHVSAYKPLEVCCGRGRATSVWLRNGGPCTLDLEMSAGPLFHVSPEKFRIQAADHMELLLSAADSAGRIGTHASDTRCEGILEATVMPQGFKVALVSLVGSSEQHTASNVTALAGDSKRSQASDSKTFLTLESNRKVLLWAQIHNLASETKTLKIRNPNAEPVNMELLVSKPYNKLFQVKVAEAGDATSVSCHVRLEAGASVDIDVTRTNRSGVVATGASFIESRLVIKSHSGSYMDNKNVALYALGGELKVEFHGTHCLGPFRHLMDLKAPLAAGAVSTHGFTLVNSGDWDAFVYLATPGSPLLDAPKEASENGGRGTISVTPSCFVLRRKKSKTVSLTYKFGAIDMQLCAGGQIGTLAVIRVLFGFEALRQAAKRAFSKSSGSKRQPSEVMLPFLGSFENEGKIDGLAR